MAAPKAVADIDAEPELDAPLPVPALVEAGEEDTQLALEIVGTLREAGAVTDTSLLLSDPNMPYERYVALGRFMGHVKRASSWWIGDWIVFGEGLYGEKYAQAMHATGLQEDTLMNYAYVCRNVAPSRRRSDLGFGHHQEVAPMKPAEQNRWLKKGAKEEWSRSEMRVAIREAKALEGERQGELGDAETVSRSAQMETLLAAVVRDAHLQGDRVWIPVETFARVKALFDSEG